MPSLFVFSSKWTDHIAIAAKECVWKVAWPESQVSQLFGKAQNVFPGALGIFYTSETQTLTVPFVFASEVTHAVEDAPFLKGGPYRLEFRLFPLGPMSRRISLTEVPNEMRTHVSARLPFVSCTINKEEWLRLLGKLTVIEIESCRRLGWDECVNLLRFLNLSQ